MKKMIFTSRNKTKSSRASKLFCTFALILIVYISVMAVIILGNKNPADMIDGIQFSSEDVLPKRDHILL